VTATFSPARNAGTMIAFDPPPRPTWDALVAAHARACQAMAGAPPTSPGFRLYWARPNGIGWTDLSSTGSYAILGRHTACDAVLDADPTLPLRHLLATTVPLADGLALRLLDLQTGTPFSLGDGQARRSLVVSGPVAVSVGALVVGAVPIEETDAGLKLCVDPLVRPKVTDARTSSVMHGTGDPYRSPAKPPRYSGARATIITSMPAARSFSDLAPSRASARPDAAQAHSFAPDAAACIVVRRGKLMAAVDLSAEQLEQGVILGRADRCLDQGLMTVLNNATSRAHVLLMRNPQEPSVLDVFDLCSTNGTYVEGQRVRRIRVPGSTPHEATDGATFVLGLRDAAVTVKVRFPPARS
jgi:hypothetical protein